jgi:hypothetical protein
LVAAEISFFMRGVLEQVAVHYGGVIGGQSARVAA